MKKRHSVDLAELSANDLPAKPSEELIRWAGDNLLDIHVMIYRTGWVRDPLSGMREEVVDARCSRCGCTGKFIKVHAGSCRHSYASAPYGFLDQQNQPMISGDSMLCPYCNQPVKAMYLPEVRDDKTIATAHP